jgi:hypothetical protein
MQGSLTPKRLHTKTCDIYGPAVDVKGKRAGTARDRCHHISGLMLKTVSSLRALMQSALPLLMKTSASEAVSQVRV